MLTLCPSHSERFGVDTGFFQGFALDYRLHVDDLSLEIAGYQQRLSIISPEADVLIGKAQNGWSDPMQHINVTARVGHDDGANLPWFPTPDAMMLFWCIHKDNQEVPLVIRWFEQDGLTTLTLKAKKTSLNELLEIRIQDKDPKTIIARVPEVPVSGSTSMTYPIRVALIFLIAPTAVFVNDHFGFVIDALSNSFIILFAVMVYLFVILAMIVSLWRCLGGPSLDGIILSTQDRLDRLNRHGRLRVLVIDATKQALEKFKDWIHDDGNTWSQWFLQICKEGWHPERSRALREEAEADLEINMASARAQKAKSTPNRELGLEKSGSDAKDSVEGSTPDIDRSMSPLDVVEAALKTEAPTGAQNQMQP